MIIPATIQQSTPHGFATPASYLSMRQTLKARQHGTVHRTSLSLHLWEEHHDGTCSTCDMVVGRSGGGRSQFSESAYPCRKLLAPNIDVPFHSPPSGFFPVQRQGLACVVMTSCANAAMKIVDQAVEVPCKHLIC